MPVQFYYHPNSPPSKAIWMILEHMGLDYEPHVVDLFTDEHKKPEYLKINPLAQVPAIVDDGFPMWESRAMAAWLINQYGAQCKKSSLYPTDAKSKAIVDMALYTDSSIYEGRLLPYLNIGGVFKGEGIAEDKIDDLKAGLKMYEYALSKHKFMAGDHLTIADFSALNSMYVLSYVEFKGWSDYPNISRWFEKEMKVLPCFAKCIQEPKDVFKEMYQGALAARKQSEAPAETPEPEANTTEQSTETNDQQSA
uniref:glutathione S-transferase D4-like n=1 Tax=Styela clava TaxID=7725 RepID=UPI00193AC3DF|nr:glutathione S-transferase D4-like [Styela clava]